MLLATKLVEGDPRLQHLTEEEIAAGVVKASVMLEESDNGLVEPQESAFKEKLLSCTRDGIVAVINDVGSSTDENCGHIMNAKTCEGDPN